MSDSSIVIIQGTVGLYTVATRCHICFAVTLKYTEDSSLTILRHSLTISCDSACATGGLDEQQPRRVHKHYYSTTSDQKMD